MASSATSSASLAAAFPTSLSVVSAIFFLRSAPIFLTAALAISDAFCLPSFLTAFLKTCSYAFYAILSPSFVIYYDVNLPAASVKN